MVKAFHISRSMYEEIKLIKLRCDWRSLLPFRSLYIKTGCHR